MLNARISTILPVFGLALRVKIDTKVLARHLFMVQSIHSI